MENNRKKFHNDIECVPLGFANGSAPGAPFTEREKEKMIEEARKKLLSFPEVELFIGAKLDIQKDYSIASGIFPKIIRSILSPQPQKLGRLLYNPLLEKSLRTCIMELLVRNGHSMQNRQQSHLSLH